MEPGGWGVTATFGWQHNKDKDHKDDDEPSRTLRARRETAPACAGRVAPGARCGCVVPAPEGVLPAPSSIRIRIIRVVGRCLHCVGFCSGGVNPVRFLRAPLPLEPFGIYLVG